MTDRSGSLCTEGMRNIAILTATFVIMQHGVLETHYSQELNKSENHMWFFLTKTLSLLALRVFQRHQFIISIAVIQIK